MESIIDGIAKGSHDYSPIQRQIIEVIYKEFGTRVRISAVPKNLREMDLSVYFVDSRETVSF